VVGRGDWPVSIVTDFRECSGFPVVAPLRGFTVRGPLSLYNTPDALTTEHGRQPCAC